MILLSVGETSASEGIGSVVIAFFGAVGAMALIYAVLAVMERVNKKKHPEQSGKDDTQEDSAGTITGEETVNDDKKEDEQ